MVDTEAAKIFERKFEIFGQGEKDISGIRKKTAYDILMIMS
jgi:hypothetical protein